MSEDRPTYTAGRPRRDLLLEATHGAHPEYVRSALYIEESEGPAGAALEFSVLFSWIDGLIERGEDDSWLRKRLDAIAHRGGPRDDLDEVYLELGLTPEQAAGIAKIIREKQLEVARGFFGIHSGAYNFEFEPLPSLRFTIHYGHTDENYVVVDDGALPNAIDEMFMAYTERR